jgi:hypothetical protein
MLQDVSLAFHQLPDIAENDLKSGFYASVRFASVAADFRLLRFS